MHLGSGQVPNRTLCFHCALISRPRPSPPINPPASAPIKQIRGCKCCCCWAVNRGTSGVQPVPVDEWHFTANAPPVCLCKWDKDERFVQAAPCPCPFWTLVLHTVWVEWKSWVLFIAVDHLSVSLLEFNFMEEEWSHFYASCGVVPCWYSSGLCPRWTLDTLTHTFLPACWPFEKKNCH